jgi:hypothetical protein
MKTTLIQRLRNIWKLGEEKEIPPDTDVRNYLAKELSFDYGEKKPMATIIKRKMSDEEVVDELLKE